MMKKKNITAIITLVSFIVCADVVTIITDTEMNGWTKAYVTGAVTNATLTAKTSGGNPDAFGEWAVQRSDGGGLGSVKVKELETVEFRLDLQEFYSTYNAASIDSITVNMDVRYGIGNANIGMRKYTSEGVFVAEGFTTAFIGGGNPSWETESVTFDADSSSFSSQASQMTFDNEAYYYTFSLIFFSNTSVETSIGQFDNFSVDITYTTVPEPATIGLFSVSSIFVLLFRKRIVR